MSTSTGRVIVVLGYSKRGAASLDPVCRARLERAAEVSRPDDVVVLSGWSRGGRGRPEAELMAEAWNAPVAEVVVDPDARSTVGNASNALNDVLRVHAREVVIVTSAWHAPRARAAFRWLLRGTGVRVASASPAGRSWQASLRELLLWPLLPFQLEAARRSSSRANS